MHIWGLSLAQDMSGVPNFYEFHKLAIDELECF